MAHFSVLPGHFLPVGRLEAFSDGVFAIVITLLVLDLRVPESTDLRLSQLAAEWPSFLGYVVSFAFIGGSWIAHTALTHLLRVTDGVVLGLNLIQLLLIALLPFSTSLFTKHLTSPSERIAVVIFGLNITLSTLISAAMASYVKRVDEVKSDAHPAKAEWLERQRWTTFTLFALSTAVSALAPKVAVGFYLLFSLKLIGQPLSRLHKRVWRQRTDDDSAG